MADDESSVRVAVRIRPQLPKEVLEMCRICTTVTPGEPQVTLGTDKSFTYDYVFDTDADQLSVYEACAKSLVQGSLEGYNATVFAYGQTGSGKTYTMGTGFDVDVNSELVGIIPRAINDLFEGIQRITEQAKENLQPPPQFKVTAQFLELYNEEIIDLFESAREFTKGKGAIKIHEDASRSIYLSGVRTEKVSSPEEALQWLKQGSLARTTASTRMNAQSSRSHAIFTLHIRQQRVVSAEQNGDDDDNKNGDTAEGNGDFETLSAKFHFVDLAGSERLKRTGATGDRAKEGISINCGLLALGNVISALGDQSKRALHVPYRDSKLTRLLQDSLGGNSRTLMIACVSPSDGDFMETLNTLNYANRARNIKNKVVINQDKSSRTIALLKKQIQELQCELLEYKQGKRVVGEDGIEAVNDMFHENTLLTSELESLRTRVKAMQATIDSLKADKVELLRQRTMAGFNQDGDNKNDDMSQMVEEYIKEIEELRTKLMESESTCAELRKAASRSRNQFNSRSVEPEPDIGNIIELAKKQVEKEASLLSSRKKDDNSDSDDGSGGSSDSDGEGDESEENKHNEYSAELAQLTSDISVKQQLIEALEKSQKKMQNMKQHYEEKLMQLQSKIEATVKERDSVLASYSKGKNQLPSDKVKKVKEEYEQKLSALQREMKSLQTAKREHSRLLKNQGQYEAQIRTLSNEVMDMKKMKVKLMNKMKEETQRHKEAETRRNREIAQLKKQGRIDANIIKKMEAEKRAKNIVLKRKQEEVAALRTAANQKLRLNKRANDASPRKAKTKWASIETNIAQSTLNKHQMVSLEREMNRKIEYRQEIQQELKQKKLLLSDPRFKNNSTLMEEAENLQVTLDHIQSAITDLQNEILLVEENKVTEGSDILNTVVDTKEAAYILEKLYSMALHQSCLVAQNESAIRELHAENAQLKKDSEMQEQLLRHLVENQEKEPGRRSPNGNSSSDPSSRSTSPVDNGSVISNLSRRENGKQRRKMMAPQDLLFQNENNSGNSSLSSSFHGGQSLSAATSPEHHPAPGSILAPPPLTRSLTTIKVMSVPASPVTLRKGLTLSPRINRKTFIISSNHPSMEKGLDSSPPGSPPVYRRQTSREENVFSRLTSQQSTQIPTSRRPGKINPVIPKRSKNRLQLTHLIEGHSKAVLALHATDDKLFTASKDQTVVMWDLRELRESHVFSDYDNSVVSVKYDPRNNLLYSVFSCFVKVIDVRSSKVVHTLHTSHPNYSGPSVMDHLLNKETVNAIVLSGDGTVLYTAVSERVKLWDTRKFCSVGKLFGGFKAAVMCLALAPTSNGDDIVVTGSKDHYIKVFDVNPAETNRGFLPRVTLEPPHYDGIQCLALRGRTLFSGSRDCNIKKWTLDSNELVMSMNGAHRDWVTDLCFSPNDSLVVSGSRDGFVKLWNVDSCTCVGELRAHDSAINALASNSSHVFTASNDGQCGIWRVAPPLV